MASTTGLSELTTSVAYGMLLTARAVSYKKGGTYDVAFESAKLERE